MQANLNYPCRGVAALASNIMSLAALVLASAGCAAQTPPTPPASPPVATGVTPPVPPSGFAVVAPPPPFASGPSPLAGAGSAFAAQVVVSRFLVNPDGEIDGFLTREGMPVHFPPHLGSQLAAMIRPGDRVQVSGWRDAGGNLAAQRITDSRSGQQLVDRPPPGAPPLPPELRAAALSRLSVQGQVARVTTAPLGEPDGVILTDGTVIKLTPPIAQQFPTLVQTGASVAAQGYGTRNQYGTALQATAFGAPGNLTQLYDRLPPAP